jgi:solute carrier family 25 (mitochondrial folate transporter), member 32
LGLSHVAIYFPIYENLKIFFTKIDANNRAESKEVFFSAIISKMIASTITYPHVVLRVRQFDNRQSTNGGSYNNNIFHLISNIYHKEGIQGFYSGLRIDLIRVIPNNTITFLVYEFTKNFLNDKYDNQF